MSKNSTGMNIGADGWDWRNRPFRKDPITGHSICFDCWHGGHGRDGCQVADCNCVCYAAVKNTAHERGLKGARTKERKELMREHLEAPDNPLRAVNSEWKHTGA